MQKYIWITTNFEGFHAYQDAPEEVSFLRNKHRHTFYAKVFIEVCHNNRDIEFIIFKRFINKLIDAMNKDDLGSCEMIADYIYEGVASTYLGRGVMIEISEDNENGCLCKYQ